MGGAEAIVAGAVIVSGVGVEVGGAAIGEVGDDGMAVGAGGDGFGAEAAAVAGATKST